MAIRKAVVGDAEALKGLYSELREYEMGLLDPEVLEFQLNWEIGKQDSEIMKFLTSDDIAVFIAEHDGDVIGFVTCGFSVGQHFREGALDIYVKSGHRGRGLGTALIDSAMGWFREMDCGAFMINLYAANARARDFYKKCGMKLVGETYKMRL